MDQAHTQSIINYLTERFPLIHSIYVFGSTISKQTTPNSDLDLAIICDAPIDTLYLWETKENLASLLNIDIDLIDLSQATTVLRYQIISTGECIYTKNKKKTQTQEVTWMSMYLDFNDSRKDLLDDIYEKGNIYG